MVFLLLAASHAVLIKLFPVMPKLMISSYSIFCDVYMRMKKKSQQGKGMSKQHTKPYKAGVYRLLSTRMALGFQSPKNLIIEPKNFLQSLRSVVN